MKERGKTVLFYGGYTQQKEEVQSFEHEWGEPSPLPPLVENPDPLIKNTLRSVLYLITVISLKRVREGAFYFKATNLQHVRINMEEVTKFSMLFSLHKITIHYKVRCI